MTHSGGGCCVKKISFLGTVAGLMIGSGLALVGFQRHIHSQAMGSQQATHHSAVLPSRSTQEDTSPAPHSTKPREKNRASSSKRNPSTAPFPRSRTRTVTLSVSTITPLFGTNPVSFRYPSQVTVRVPRNWASQIQAVGTDGYIFLIPKGWTGSSAEGTDGSKSVNLHPAGTSLHHGIGISLETAGACVGCAWSEAYPYFSWIRQRYQGMWGYADHAATIPGYHAAPNLRFYQYKGRGRAVNGIAYAPLIRNPESTVLFRRVQTSLPSGEHGLATLMLNYLLPQITQSS